MSKLIRVFFYTFIVNPVIYVLLGINVRRRYILPEDGPAIIIANHNSHLDTMVLRQICPKPIRDVLRPVAARDYFMSNPFLRWFSKNILNIIPIERHVDLAKEDPLLPASKALSQNEVVILYPEGTRGEPERLASFKKGIAYLAQKHPYVPIIPVYIHGLGKALPKGELILVPFFCDVFVGAPMNWTGDINSFMRRITDKMKGLEREGHFPEWI